MRFNASTLSSVGFGLQTASAFAAADAQNRANDFNAMIQEKNAGLLEYRAMLEERRADEAISRGKEDVRRHRLKVAQIRGQQRASFAGAGIVVDAGTPLEVLLETTAAGEEDALTLRDNARREAFGIRSGAASLRAEAANLKFRGSLLRSTRADPTLSVGASLFRFGADVLRNIPGEG